MESIGSTVFELPSTLNPKQTHTLNISETFRQIGEEVFKERTQKPTKPRSPPQKAAQHP